MGLSNTQRHWQAANYTSRPCEDHMESVWTDYNTRQVEAEQRRLLKTGIGLALSILLGIGLGVALERGWTAMNADAVEVAK